jgi:hypothetical protein
MGGMFETGWATFERKTKREKERGFCSWFENNSTELGPKFGSRMV